jgi:hypothetical protein
MYMIMMSLKLYTCVLQYWLTGGELLFAFDLVNVLPTYTFDFTSIVFISQNIFINKSMKFTFLVPDV